MSEPVDPFQVQEFAALATRLEDRASVVDLAWSFGLGCVAFVATGVGIKLLRDSIRTPTLAYVLLGLGTALIGGALFRLVRGLGRRAAELRDLQRFLELRHAVHLDAPRFPEP